VAETRSADIGRNVSGADTELRFLSGDIAQAPLAPEQFKGALMATTRDASRMSSFRRLSRSGTPHMPNCRDLNF
jgi:hypothetical protein